MGVKRPGLNLKIEAKRDSEGRRLGRGDFLFCLFVLLLYVPSQQLWSLRDGQFT